MDALNLPAPKQALKHTSLIKKKLVFAEKIQYEARKGCAAVSSNSVDLHLYKIMSTPVINFGTTLPIQKEQQTEDEVSPNHTSKHADNSSARKEQCINPHTIAQNKEDDLQFHKMVDDMVFQV
jgi:hypothetical protein